MHASCAPDGVTLSLNMGALFAQAQAQAQARPWPSSASASQPGLPGPVTGAERERVVQALAEALQGQYPDPETGSATPPSSTLTWPREITMLWSI
jgi:hypothetical protein